MPFRFDLAWLTNPYSQRRLPRDIDRLKLEYAISIEWQAHRFPHASQSFHSLESFSELQLGSLPKIILFIRLIILGIHHTDANEGYGKMLINHAFDVEKASVENIGCYGMYLDADAGALAKGFYQKLGFRFLEGEKIRLLHRCSLPLQHSDPTPNQTESDFRHQFDCASLSPLATLRCGPLRSR